MSRFARPLGLSLGVAAILLAAGRSSKPDAPGASGGVSFVDEVIAAGACDPATKAMYARGRIVIWPPCRGATRERARP
jgi:hypothetical protein